MVERAGGRALAVPGDVSAPDAVAHVVRTAESQLGMVDILVNNAGAVGPLGYDWEVDLEDWWRTFEINVRGPFLYARAVLPGRSSANGDGSSTSPPAQGSVDSHRWMLTAPRKQH